MKKTRRDEPKPTEPRLETLRLADLAQHPDQDRFFRRYGVTQYAALKADIAENGVRYPIEVMPPDNAAGLVPHTILAWHTRRKILGELGHTTAEVLDRGCPHPTSPHRDLVGWPRGRSCATGGL